MHVCVVVVKGKMTGWHSLNHSLIRSAETHLRALEHPLTAAAAAMLARASNDDETSDDDDNSAEPADLHPPHVLRLVVEDGVTFPPDLLPRLAAVLRALPADWDVLSLAAEACRDRHDADPAGDARVVAWPHDPACARGLLTAYATTAAGARRLRAALSPLQAAPEVQAAQHARGGGDGALRAFRTAVPLVSLSPYFEGELADE